MGFLRSIKLFIIILFLHVLVTLYMKDFIINTTVACQMDFPAYMTSPHHRCCLQVTTWVSFKVMAYIITNSI